MVGHLLALARAVCGSRGFLHQEVNDTKGALEGLSRNNNPLCAIKKFPRALCQTGHRNVEGKLLARGYITCIYFLLPPVAGSMSCGGGVLTDMLCRGKSNSFKDNTE